LEIEGYRIIRQLGQGGMGAVYLAEQRDLGRTVAVKVLSPELSQHRSLIQRFEREEHALARLQHPSIVWIFSKGRTRDGRYFFAMEYVDGQSLRRLQAERRLAVTRAVPLVLEVAETLAYAHSEAIIHRDIKPENIMVREGPCGRLSVKILDFGLAGLVRRDPDQHKLTRDGVTLGTPLYMSPEQRANPGSVDARADIYSLGVVFYELLTGDVPEGLCLPPSRVNPESPPILDGLVLRMLDSNRDRRHQSMNQVVVEIRAARIGNVAPPLAVMPPPAEPIMLTRPFTTERKRVVIEGRATVGHQVFVLVGQEVTATRADAAGIFTAEILLKDGKNLVTARAVDSNGRESRLCPVLEVMSPPLPPELTRLPDLCTEGEVTVRGSSNTADRVHLRVGDHESHTCADDRGRFEMLVQLEEGPNTLGISVEVDGARSRESVVRIGRPLSAPRLDEPSSPTTSPFVDLAGTSVPESTVTLTVGGRSVESLADEQGRFAARVPLSVGANTIRAQASKGGVGGAAAPPLVVHRRFTLGAHSLLVGGALLAALAGLVATRFAMSPSGRADPGGSSSPTSGWPTASIATSLPAPIASVASAVPGPVSVPVAAVVTWQHARSDPGPAAAARPPLPSVTEPVAVTPRGSAAAPSVFSPSSTPPRAVVPRPSAVARASPVAVAAPASRPPVAPRTAVLVVPRGAGGWVVLPPSRPLEITARGAYPFNLLIVPADGVQRYRQWTQGGRPAVQAVLDSRWKRDHRLVLTQGSVGDLYVLADNGNYPGGRASSSADLRVQVSVAVPAVRPSGPWTVQAGPAGPAVVRPSPRKSGR
ncbi:MAG: serine/threonine protein kinase, partial [Candidatus Riflebacteria bacterium]|nr:serine/threonine protein kinase [Candidatus Riflebacteria bacterium]